MGKNTFLVWALIVVIVIGGYVGYTQLSQTPDTPPQPQTEETTSPPPQPQSESQKEKVSKDDTNKVNTIPVSSITRDMKGQYVVTSGTISTISGGKGHTFITLRDIDDNNKTIKCVLFRQENEKNTGRKTLLEEKAESYEVVNIEGVVDIYENELEIIIKKLY